MDDCLTRACGWDACTAHEIIFASDEELAHLISRVRRNKEIDLS